MLEKGPRFTEHGLPQAECEGPQETGKGSEWGQREGRRGVGAAEARTGTERGTDGTPSVQGSRFTSRSFVPISFVMDIREERGEFVA